MDRRRIRLSSQLRWVLWFYVPVMTANSIAIARWSFTRPISISATFFMLVGRGVLGDASGQPTAAAFALYALLNLAIVWGSVLLILRGPRVLGWVLLLLLVLSALPLALAERPAPFW